MNTHANKTHSALVLALLFTLLAALPIGSAAAQSVDVVHLKNGGVIRGTIVEQTPGESLKLKTRDGSVFVYAIDEIDRVSKDFAQATMPGSTGYDTPRNPGVAFALSWLMPGAGQMYNGETKKGAIQMGLSVVGYLAFFNWYPEEMYVDTGSYDSYGGYYIDTGNEALSGLGLLVGLGTHVWSMIDAPSSASRINRSQSFSLAEIPLGEEMAISISPLAPGSLQVEPTVAVSMSF